MGKVSTKLILSVILFLLTSLSTFAQDEQSNPSAQTDELSVVNALEKTSNDNVDENKPAQTVEELTNKLNDIIEFHGIPGISVAIVENQQVILATGLGLSNIENEEQATENTRFRIGSVSKMFVGLAALKLAEEGLLDLQSPVKDLIPEIEFDNPYSATHPVRVIHLLQHTTGWDDIHLKEYANNDPTPISLKDGLDYHPASRVSRWRPGERMSYSNSGPPVAAYIVQKITGVDFEQYVQDNLFTLMDMQSATYRQTQSDLTTLYVDNTPVDYWHILMRPSGSINASAVDMANFLEFLVNSGTFADKQILKANSIRIMETPSTTLAAKAGMPHGYGITNYTSFYKGLTFQGHDGGVQGGAARLVYSTELGVGFYFAVNTNSLGMTDIFNAIATYVTRNKSTGDLPESVTLTDDTIAKYSGFYMPINPRQEMMRFSEQISAVRALRLDSGGGKMKNGDKDDVYVPVSENLLRLASRPLASIALLEDEDGLAIQVGNQYLRKISSFRHYSQQSFTWAFAALLVFHFFWFFWFLGSKLLGKSTTSAATQVKLWPFLASWSIYIFVIAMIIGQIVDVFGLLGQPSIVSVGMMISSYLFALFTLIAVVQNVRYFKEELHWFTRYMSLFSCVVYSVAAIYFAYFGVIGIATYS